ncbi:hypothetical protein ACFL02_06310 [Planctomycetota bacterium]
MHLIRTDGCQQKNLSALTNQRLETTENGQILIADSFDSTEDTWKEIYLAGAPQGGSHRISQGQLSIETTETKSVYGVYYPQKIAGHFYAEVEFNQDRGVGLALIQEKNGKPDPDNFTSIRINANAQGKVVVEVRDRQNGVDNVLDHSGKMQRQRYQTVLDNQRSVPFDHTNKKIRIFRDGPAGFFHFYYAVKKNIRDQEAQGWMELAPGPDWGTGEQNFYVALYVHTEGACPEQVSFDNLRVMQKPTQDQDDQQTGFKVIRRDYNWSGFSGEAVVITFDKEFGHHQKDKKFVFWSEMNYIPAWHLNNQLLFSYEFLETWGGDNPGCYEPMSDRLLRWSDVEIIEDNDVRKVVHWHYVLCTPDYKVPNDPVGAQLPEGDEYWTFYPDGTAVRYIEYRPKLDGSFRKVHELTEMIAVAGSSSYPRDHTAEPALTLLNLQGEINHYHPNKNFDDKCNQWDQVILTGHFKSEPDAFVAYSHAADTPDTFSNYPFKFEVTWHSHRHTLAHWPVSKEPFQKADATGGTFRAQPMHTCLISGSIYEGIDWNDHYQLDSNGRKYRQWAALVGLNPPGDYDSLRNQTAVWLYPGKITMLDSSSQFAKISYKQKELVFKITSESRLCRFQITPEPKSRGLIHPVFKINNWYRRPVRIKCNDKELTPETDYKWAYEGDAVVIWINGRFDGPTAWTIQEKSL